MNWPGNPFFILSIKDTLYPDGTMEGLGQGVVSSRRSGGKQSIPAFDRILMVLDCIGSASSIQSAQRAKDFLYWVIALGYAKNFLTFQGRSKEVKK